MQDIRSENIETKRNSEMAFTMQTGDLKKLKYFIDFALENPTFLNMPQLQFVKDFVEKFGGTVPPGQFNGGSAGG